MKSQAPQAAGRPTIEHRRSAVVVCQAQRYNRHDREAAKRCLQPRSQRTYLRAEVTRVVRASSVRGGACNTLRRPSSWTLNTEPDSQSGWSCEEPTSYCEEFLFFVKARLRRAKAPGLRAALARRPRPGKLRRSHSAERPCSRVSTSRRLAFSGAGEGRGGGAVTSVSPGTHLPDCSPCQTRLAGLRTRIAAGPAPATRLAVTAHTRVAR